MNGGNRGRAIIIGGSIAGLCAAIMLRSCGWSVAIYERASEALTNRGAGIATHDALYEWMRKAGVELRDEMGVPSNGRMMLDIDGSIIGKHDMDQVMTSWGLLWRFMRAQVPDDIYHHGCAFRDFEITTESVRAHFEGRKSVEGDWIIGADGARSTMRQLVAPQNDLEYCGYFLWRGLFTESLIPPDVLAQVAHRLTFSMAPGGHWLGYLVAGRDDDLTAGNRWYNWGWYRTGDEDMLRDHLTDADGNYYPQGIPHDLIRPELIEGMRAETRQRLAPQMQAIVAATPKPFLQGIYEAGCERLIYDRCILIGDAAFTGRPHVGMGVSKAAEDAALLAEALCASAQAVALADWERDRLTYGKGVVQWGRDLGSYCGPAPRDAAGRAKAAHYQRPEVLMSLTAASDPDLHIRGYQ